MLTPPGREQWSYSLELRTAGRPGRLQRWGWRFGRCDLGLFAAGQQRRGIGQHAHGYDTDNNSKAMGLLYALIVDNEDGTTTVQVEANSKEEALESGEELYPGCRLALVNPKCAEDQI